MNSAPFNASAISDPLTTLKTQLCTKWWKLDSEPDDSTVFRYKLCIRNQKILDGQFKFLVQLNNDRTTKRRTPQIISTVTPAFDSAVFNFNKVSAAEVLLEDVAIDVGNDVVVTASFLINNSPMTPHHMLICPARAANLPQILTAPAIAVAVRVLRLFNDRSYRICYNSPGAWASVNHLHLHVLHVPQRLYVENVPLRPLNDKSTLASAVHRIDDQFGPVDGLAFRVAHTDSPVTVAEHVMRLVNALCERQIPHNIFFTIAEQDDSIIRIFVFPKEHHSATKEFSTFNVAACELSGYVTIGNADQYAIVNEAMIVAKMRAEVGGSCERIVDELGLE